MKKILFFFQNKKKDKTKIELILNEIGIPTDNKKLVRNCLICLYSYALYFLISVMMLPLVLIYSASIIEGVFMYIVITLSLIILPLIIKPLSVTMNLFVTRKKVLYSIFNKQRVSKDILNIIKNSFDNEMIKQSMIYHLMNVGDKCGTNYRFKEYLSGYLNEDSKFEEKISSINNNMIEKMKELRDAQESWEDKQVLNTACNENISEDSLANNKI